MSKKRMIVWIGALGITTLLVSQVYAGGLCGMSDMSGGSCKAQHEYKQVTIEKVKCAYDGMEMDKQKMKAHMKYKGQTLYFCTREERKEFKKDPEGYLSGKKKGEYKETTGQQVQYTCSMHPEVISDKPGKCPKCGMNLEKKK